MGRRHRPHPHDYALGIINPFVSLDRLGTNGSSAPDKRPFALGLSK